VKPFGVFSGAVALAAVVGIGGDAYARYLQPEPLMQNPKAVVAYAMRGIQLNPYAYAASNPLSYADPNGREVRIGASCMLRNPAFETYLRNMSRSLDLQRRRQTPHCTAGAAKGEQFPTNAIEKLLNDPYRIVNVECFDEALYNANGQRRWAYSFNQANRIEIYGGGWDPIWAAQKLAHELTHMALDTQWEWTPQVVESCTAPNGCISQ
jgi:hypothetical protein